MGSNVSTSNNKPKKSTSNAYNRSQESQLINATSTAKAEVTAVADRNYNNKNNNNKANDDNKTNVIEIINKPVSLLNHSTNNINRVIPFHSSIAWREYFKVSRNSDKLMVIFFTSKWCGFYRYMGPVLDDLATQYTDVEIHKIDVDELSDISRQYRVTTMPTLLFMKRGKEVDKVIGAMHKEIRIKIEKHRA